MERGFKGISFPFRLGVRGGIAISTTDRHKVTHIEESIQQILGTRLGERVMEYGFGSDLDTQVFEPNDPVTHNLIKYQIAEALDRFEPRIKVRDEDIEIFAKDERVYAMITYTVVKYMADYTAIMEIGGEVGGK
jgi:phage baseplate assembly protein W